MPFPHPALIEIAAGRAPGHLVSSERILSSAREHRMTGLLWSCVREGGVSVGGPDRKELAQDDLAVRAHTRRLWAVLRDVVDRLNALSFEVATVKGVTAEARWYSRVGERPSSDVDLLVAPKDVRRIADVVEVLDPGYPYRSGLQRRVASGLQPGVTLQVDDTAVDLHADLLKLGAPSRTATMLWERSVLYQAPDGAWIRVLDPEAQLFHFLIHLNKDRFPCLLGFVDVIRVIQREDLDWAAFGELARAEGVQRAIARSLDAVFSTVGMASPSAGLAMPRRSRSWQVAYRPSVRLQGLQAISPPRRRHLLLPLAVVPERRAEVLRALLRRVLPPRADVAAMYPDERGPYAIRLIMARTRRAFRHRRERRQRTGRDRRSSRLPSQRS
jgi:hypothetical protein